MSAWHRSRRHGAAAGTTPEPGVMTPPDRDTTTEPDVMAPPHPEVTPEPDVMSSPDRPGTDEAARPAGDRPGVSSARADYAPDRPYASDATHPYRAADTDWYGEPAWQERSRLVLTPIAAPSILGLFGFAGATFMVASNLAGWWGNAVTTPLVLAPFAATFGGLAQFLAGMWAYRARDGVATAMHGTWGAFWLAYGLMALFISTGRMPAAALAGRAFGFWFITLCVVTAFGALAALRGNLALATVLSLLAIGSGLLAAGLVGSVSGLVTAAGWVLVASAAAAFYTAGAMMLQQAWGGRPVLPVGERAGIGESGHGTRVPIQYAAGMPGARAGQ